MHKNICNLEGLGVIHECDCGTPNLFTGMCVFRHTSNTVSTVLTF